MMCCRKLSCLLHRRDDEVLPLDLAVLAHLPAVRADHRQRRLAAERRVGQHHRPALAGVGDQRVAYVDQGVAVGGSDAVQQQVHRRQPGGAVDQLVAGDERRRAGGRAGSA